MLGIDDYVELLPDDLCKKYMRSKEYEKIYIEMSKSTVNIFRGDELIKGHLEGTYLDGFIYILKSDVDIVIGDSIEYYDSDKGVTLTYRVNELWEEDISSSLLNYFQLNVTLTNREIPPPTNIYNTEFIGNNNKFLVDSILVENVSFNEEVKVVTRGMEQFVKTNLDSDEDITKILSVLKDLEKSKDKKSFREKYSKLIEVSSHHMTILHPFIQRLIEFL